MYLLSKETILCYFWYSKSNQFWKSFLLRENVFFVKQRKKILRHYTKINWTRKTTQQNSPENDVRNVIGEMPSTDMSYGLIFAHQTDPI